MRSFGSLLLATVLFCAAGCHSSPYYSAQFLPATNEIPVGVPEREEAKVRTLLSVRGVLRADAKTGSPARVEVVMRIENLGRVPCTLEQHSMQLLTGDLEPFGAAQITSPDPPVIAPDATSNFVIYFPMPGGRDPDHVNFKSLNLRWTLVFDGQGVTTGATFERIYPAYGDPWSNVHFGVGVGVHAG
jgi:hypothetical protein